MKKFFKCSSLILALILLFSFQIVKADGSNETTFEDSNLQINLTNFPTQITVGCSYNIEGSVSSNFNISNIRGLIYKGSELLYCVDDETFANPTYINITSSAINTNIKFGDLKLGNYTFCI